MAAPRPGEAEGQVDLLLRSVTMLLEERDYRIRAGFLGDFVDCYMRLGLPIQCAHLGEPVGFFTSDIGELNHFVSMWRWQDLGERAARREKCSPIRIGPATSPASRGWSIRKR